MGFLIALILHSSNKTPLGAFHLRQSLGLNLTIVASYIIIILLGSLGDGLLDILSLFFVLLVIGSIIFWITGLVNVYNGRMKTLPVIGDFYQNTFEKWFN